MILNRQRLLLFFAIAIMALFSVTCVDIPTAGITPPNYQSSVKYFHAGRGSDTISFPISSAVFAKKESTTVYTLSGTDSVKTVSRYAYDISIKRFRRYDVNFGQPLDLYVDGNLLSTMQFGTATNYITTLSGSRKIVLKGNGNWVDSLRITKLDTTISITRDTIRNGKVIGKSRFDTAQGGTVYNFIPVTGTEKLIVDSTLMSIETERQMSIYFEGDTISGQITNNGYTRYGRIQFINLAERKTFQPEGRVDSALIRINNIFPKGMGLSRQISTGTVSLTTLAFRGSTANTPYRAKVDTTYKFYFTNVTTSAVDSISLTVSKGKQYSISVFDSAGVSQIRAFNH